MRNMLIIGLLLSLAFAVGCTQQKVGSDSDEHGCIGSAGYRWCPSTEKCQRMWEEYCQEYAGEYRGVNITSFDECVAAGNPVMESYPRQCRAQGKTFVEEIKQGLTEEEAYAIAEQSDCVDEGSLKETAIYNSNSKTWWIDLNASRPACTNPACVVSEDTRTAEINWRCTGLVPE